MEYQELVEEIIRRVSERLAGAADPAGKAVDPAKPGLLVLAQGHGADCHSLLENAVVLDRYRMECALDKNYEVDLDGYETVVLFGLSCGALAALASGIWDSAYTRLASQAILAGKRVFVPAEEVELYRCQDKAPAPYYRMLLRKLQLLTDAGVVVCAGTELEQLLLGDDAQADRAPALVVGSPPVPPTAEPAAAPEEVRLDKRVLTERDIITAQKEGAVRIRVTGRCIITALAADTAAGCGIMIIRDGE